MLDKFLTIITKSILRMCVTFYMNIMFSNSLVFKILMLPIWFTYSIGMSIIWYMLLIILMIRNYIKYDISVKETFKKVMKDTCDITLEVMREES